MLENRRFTFLNICFYLNEKKKNLKMNFGSKKKRKVES